ncbi:peptidoglycan DD-metalloendopeptidase family protein [Nocardia sp. NPDC050710]|uniref:peptidoglycan DD-metalloendopeptidase family protein n=1 Tax=Nocardia sp. NPDC050710 TaxID=3157220 RepID=UPI0033D7D576
MKPGALAAATMIVWLTAISMVVLLMLDDNKSDCTPTRSAPGTQISPGSKVAPMKTGTYRITSGFGPREGGEFHRGVDMGADAGTPIYAAADGVVAAAGAADGFGAWIVLDHNIDGEAMSTVYGHMFPNDITVSAGEHVSAGQQIALVGYNGQTVPAGPGGAHLHFETWSGTRLGGGQAQDPAAWLAGASDPAGGQRDSTPNPSTRVTTSQHDPDVTVSEPGAVLPPLPPEKGSEEHLQVDAVRVARTIAVQFPEIARIGGWRQTDKIADHPQGRAVDVMIPDYTSGEGKALGDRVADYVIANAQALRVEYVIWRGVYRPVNGEPATLESDGWGDTANHMDHVHITVTGGGYPDGSPVTGTSGRPGTGCATAATVDDDLAAGTVPAEYEQWYRKAGALCPQIKASLLAAQGHAESGFNPKASSGVADGISQFRPSTAAAINPDDGQPYVLDSDGNGTASVWDPGDAIIGQGRYMCAIAHKIDTWIDEGTVHALNGRTELYLAAYNAGEGAVLNSGGFPTGATDYQIQTRPYVDKILSTAPQYSRSLD